MAGEEVVKERKRMDGREMIGLAMEGWKGRGGNGRKEERGEGKSGRLGME